MSDKTPYEQLAGIDGLTFSDCVTFFAKQRTERELAIIAWAQDRDKEGELEVDDNAILSEGDDNGTYVLAWLWLDFAGTPFDKEREDTLCENCGGTFNANSEDEAKFHDDCDCADEVTP